MASGRNKFQAAGPRGRRQLAERRGRRAEWAAAVLLVLKGYRIIARRYRCAAGEIDIIAVRGRRIAFVEVKLRQTAEQAEIAVSARQADRIGRAAADWMARHPQYARYEAGLDVVLAVSGHLPRHFPGACQL